jgi:hypothetical protein
MEENKLLCADLKTLRQQCTELELDQGCWLKIQQLSEKALQAESRRMMAFSSDVKAALESAVKTSDANPKVHDSFFSLKISNR